MESNRKWLIIGAAITVVLQIVLAPNIAIGDAMPNFIVAFVIVAAIVSAEEQHYVLAFVMGLISDLLGDGAVGSMSLCLLLAVFCIGFAVRYIGNDNLVMTLVIIFIAALAVDMVYSVFLISAGVANFVDGMVYRAIPCAVYDAVIGIIFYLVLVRLTSGTPTRKTGRKNPSTTPNLRFN